MGGMQRTMGTMETNVVTAVRDEGKKMKEELIAAGSEEVANLFRGGGSSRAAAASASAQTTRTSTMAGSAGELVFTELQSMGITSRCSRCTTNAMEKAILMLF
jgi:hypothetical protein